jgi:enamine deaminase RidA (YjgF/YER057c/UK114 family)
MTIEPNNPKTVAAPDGQFSQCVIVPAGTSMLFISGQVPRHLAGATLGIGDMRA